MKNFCLVVIAVQYGPWCPTNKEPWYVLKIMGSYFSGTTNKNKLPLSYEYKDFLQNENMSVLCNLV